ncbi:hypothetical protein BJ322DRAFT_1044110 [Thelephora terrestris]|uniref:Uncharacterized protein n=1 Tax=Thelephora terrestris TaxID=56493 RepID=A0A9P6HMV8_9AGAM|nr:hypothetical protein BJ322DRAFT_1044110 [Thelephora terrestris]
MEFAEPISPGSVLPPSEVVRVVVDGKEFEITDSQTALLASGKLWETEDGSYVLPDEWNVHPSQFSALFDLLHSKTKRPLENFDDIASVLTLSSPSRLNLPDIYAIAKESLSSFFPHTPTPYYEFGQSEEALVLAIEHDVKPVQKTLYYALITHSDIGVEGEDSSEPHEIHPILSSHPELVKTCQHLQSKLISHFTPVLFTVSTAGHMACTDALADHWMASVIGPALSDPTGGVSAPIEALQKIREINWKELDLCEECVQDKREEWKGEVDTIWEKMDEWLGIIPYRMVSSLEEHNAP